jgi:transcriptional regulator with GAF, ATPase, and Fis domain
MAFFDIREGDSTRRVALFKNITRIGADPTSDLALAGGDVAEDHAHVLREGEDFFVMSLGRGKTILVNGKKEKKTRLHEGDLVQIGNAELRFLPHEGAQEAVPENPTLRAYGEIVRFSERLLRSKSLADLLPALMDRVVDVSRADKGFLVMFQDGQPQVRIARNIRGEDLDNAVAELSDSILQKVVREQQPVIVSDAINDSEFQSSVSIMNLRLLSVMCVPLTEDGEIIGLIYLGSNRVSNLFEAQMLEMVTVFAAQASLLIRNAMLLDQLRADNEALRTDAQARAYGEVIGASDGMNEVYKTISKVAPTDVSVLITGETGTGKELVAREIHRRSTRAEGPFVCVNCGAIPENLLESELFGHVRGAFTGAVNTRIGRFQAAHGGTLFLDEIGEMPAPLQVKLLRALQDQTVTKVGDTRPEAVNIRVLAATNRIIADMIQGGTFREDLFYRLNVISLHLPPLRDRGEDLMLLGRFLLKRYTAEYKSKVTGFSPHAVVLMKKYAWPGNIRQLENRIKKAVIMSDRVQLSAEDLELTNLQLAPVVPLNQAREDFQRAYINEVLERNNGNRTKTAHDLGVDPRTIFRHLEREGEDP